MAGLNSSYWWTASSSREGLFPPESGRLYLQGTTFRRPNGTLFPWRGYSWFLGFLRYCRGEDITPDLRFFRAFGINIPRLFGPLPWVETPDYRFENFDFQKLDAFLTLLEDWGLYSNWSLTHYRSAMLRDWCNQFYEIAAYHWSVVVTERVNEPDVHRHEKPDPITDFAGVSDRGIPVAYGYYPIDKVRTIANTPIKDWGSVHTPRDSAWPRKARHGQEWQHYTGKPTVNDEPAKILEPHQSYPGGKNTPFLTPAEASWYGGVSSLWMPGFTLHTEEGKWGRVPTPGMLQYTTCEAVRDSVWIAIDASWQTGRYMGSHFDTSPVEHTDDIWTYISDHSTRALAVACGFVAPVPQNGWQEVRRWGPSGSLVELTR